MFLLGILFFSESIFFPFNAVLLILVSLVEDESTHKNLEATDLRACDPKISCPPLLVQLSLCPACRGHTGISLSLTQPLSLCQAELSALPILANLGLSWPHHGQERAEVRFKLRRSGSMLCPAWIVTTTQNLSSRGCSHMQPVTPAAPRQSSSCTSEATVDQTNNPSSISSPQQLPEKLTPGQHSLQNHLEAQLTTPALGRTA